MSDDEILSVVQAHKEGKKIQGRVLNTSVFFRRGIDGEWSDMVTPDWNFHDAEYRVAPEPRKPSSITELIEQFIKDLEQWKFRLMN